MAVPPLSSLPPPAVPSPPAALPVAGRETPTVEAPGNPPARRASTVALAVLVVLVTAACWALAARLIGQDAWVAAVGFAVVPGAVTALRGR